MPIYEYRCDKCGKHIEKRQSVSEAPLTECEECGGRLEKQWSLSGFQFKGGGWYVTDYSGKSGSEKKSGGESTATGDAASKSKTDSTAATTSDS